MSSSPAVGRARVHDIEVAYRLDGAAQAPVVMLAHGLLTSHRVWDRLVVLLESRWRLLRYDLRGHGASSATQGPYSMSQLAGDAVGLLDALGVTRVHFVGISLGGMIGQHLGALHPARFETLTLANTTCVQPARAAWQQRIEIAKTQGLEQIVQGNLPRWFTEATLETNPDLVSGVAEIARETSLAGFIGCACAVRDLERPGYRWFQACDAACCPPVRGGTSGLLRECLAGLPARGGD